MKLFKKHQARKFNYIPRYYDKENNNLIYNRIGDGKFAQNYVRKKKMRMSEELEEEKRIDLSSYRLRPNRSRDANKFSVAIIFVSIMILMAVVWLITNPDFTNIFAK